MVSHCWDKDEDESIIKNVNDKISYKTAWIQSRVNKCLLAISKCWLRPLFPCACCVVHSDFPLLSFNCILIEKKCKHAIKKFQTQYYKYTRERDSPRPTHCFCFSWSHCYVPRHVLTSIHSLLFINTLGLTIFNDYHASWQAGFQGTQEPLGVGLAAEAHVRNLI